MRQPRIKPLWERLSKENRDKILAIHIIYEKPRNELIFDLKDKGSFMDLTFTQVVWLLQETTKEQPSIENLEKLFNK